MLESQKHALSDVRAAAHSLNALLLVIGWGHTPAPTIDAGLAMSGPAKSKLAGSVLNKAAVQLLDRDAARRGWFGRKRRYSDHAGVAASDRKDAGE